MVRFFETIYYDIFEHLLAIYSKNEKLFGHVFTYFDTAETNS